MSKFLKFQLASSNWTIYAGAKVVSDKPGIAIKNPPKEQRNKRSLGNETRGTNKKTTRDAKIRTLISWEIFHFIYKYPK